MILRFIHIMTLLVLCSPALSVDVERIEDLDVRYGQVESLDLNRYSKGGFIDAEIMVHEYRVGDEWPPSARVGIMSEDRIHKVEVYVVNAKSDKGVVVGYRYFDNSQRNIQRKILSHEIPEKEKIKLQIRWEQSGDVTVNVLGTTNTIKTGIVWASPYIFSSGTKAGFRVLHGEI